MSSFWRKFRCEGCSLGCRYSDFKVFSKTGFQEVQLSLFVDTNDAAQYSE